MKMIVNLQYFWHTKIMWKVFHRMRVLDGEERKKYLEAMTEGLVEAYKKQNGKNPPLIYMNCCMFLMAKKLKERDGIDVRLPYFWFTNGVEVVWEDFTDKLVYSHMDGQKVDFTLPVRSPD